MIVAARCWGGDTDNQVWTVLHVPTNHLRCLGRNAV